MSNVLRYWSNGLGELHEENNTPDGVKWVYDNIYQHHNTTFEKYLATRSGIPGITLETKYGIGMSEEYGVENTKYGARELYDMISDYIANSDNLFVKSCYAELQDESTERDCDMTVVLFIPFFVPPDSLDGVFKGMEDKVDEELKKNYLFIPVKELAMYLHNHIGKEVGFTDDVEEYLDGGEAIGWYGVAVSDLFNANVTVFGYYGGGIERIYNPNFSDAVLNEFGLKVTINSIIDFFATEFNRKIDENTKICVSKGDLLY